MTEKEMLLVQLAEEANELAQDVAKCLRFGCSERLEGHPRTNIERVIYEFNDILAIINMLKNIDVIGDDVIDLIHVDRKMKKVEKYLAYSEKCGTLKR